MLAYIPSLLLYNGECLAEYIIFHYTKELGVVTCREAARSCRSVGRKKKKKSLMDFWSLKPLFLVLFGNILSSFETV